MNKKNRSATFLILIPVIFMFIVVIISNCITPDNSIYESSPPPSLTMPTTTIKNSVTQYNNGSFPVNVVSLDPSSSISFVTDNVFEGSEALEINLIKAAADEGKIAYRTNTFNWLGKEYIHLWGKSSGEPLQVYISLASPSGRYSKVNKVLNLTSVYRHYIFNLSDFEVKDPDLPKSSQFSLDEVTVIVFGPVKDTETFDVTFYVDSMSIWSNW